MNLIKRYKYVAQAATLVLGICIAFPICALVLYTLPTLQKNLPKIMQQTEFWRSYGNTLAVCGLAMLIQFATSILGGYALAKCDFAGKRVLFCVCVVAMLIPLQALILPQYLMLDFFGLLNTKLALIITAGFSPFGVLIMWYGYDKIPNETVEAAYCEGAGTARTLFRIALPMAKPYLASLFLIALSDLWNMLEQPMAFLKSEAQYPLSVYLAQISGASAILHYTECLLAVLPLLLLFGIVFKKTYE